MNVEKTKTVKAKSVLRKQMQIKKLKRHVLLQTL